MVDIKNELDVDSMLIPIPAASKPQAKPALFSVQDNTLRVATTATSPDIFCDVFLGSCVGKSTKNEVQFQGNLCCQVGCTNNAGGCLLEKNQIGMQLLDLLLIYYCYFYLGIKYQKLTPLNTISSFTFIIIFII